MIEWPSLPAAAAPAAPAAHSFSGPARFHLPDGTPLRLTWSRKARYVSMQQTFGVPDPEAAGLLLFLASPDYDARRFWFMPSPSEDGADPSLREENPGMFAAITRAAEEWADIHLPADQLEAIWHLAVRLWNDAHETMVVPAVEAPSEKKAEPASGPTGAPATAASSPAETPSDGTGCSTSATPETPTPPCTPSGATTESP